jgi:hypothetical protein
LLHLNLVHNTTQQNTDAAAVLRSAVSLILQRTHSVPITNTRDISVSRVFTTCWHVLYLCGTDSKYGHVQ